MSSGSPAGVVGDGCGSRKRNPLPLVSNPLFPPSIKYSHCVVSYTVVGVFHIRGGGLAGRGLVQMVEKMLITMLAVTGTRTAITILAIFLVMVTGSLEVGREGFRV